MILWIVIVGFIIGFALAFSIGANDVANSFGTSVGSKVLTLRTACILATIFETAGSVLVGAKVSNTISKGIIDITLYEDTVDLLRLGYLSSLIGACAWLIIATGFKLPVSGTHSIVGAVIGFTLVAKGFDGVKWWVLGKIAASWFISPLLSGMVSAGLYLFVHHTILKLREHKKQLSRGILLLPLFYSVTFAVNTFSVVYEGPEILYLHVVPWWGALVISFGVGLIAAGIVRFIVAPRLKRHIVKTRTAQSMAMSALNDDDDVTRKLRSSTTNAEVLAVSNDASNEKKEEAAKQVATVSSASVGASRRPSLTDSGKCSMGPPGGISGIPFLEHQLSTEYCGIPSGFASSSTASGLNSADMSGSSTPLLVTPRTSKYPLSLNLAAQKYMTSSNASATPPNSPELAPRRHQDMLSSLASSVATSSETLVTVVSAVEKKTAKFYELDTEDEHQATIVPGTSLQATLRHRDTTAPTDNNVADKSDAVENGIIANGDSKRKRTQSGRSVQSARSVASSRLAAHQAEEWPDVMKLFAFLQILTACFGAFAHGGNDVSNAVGPVIGLYQLHNTEVIPVKAHPEWWILMLGGCGISVGLWTLGRRVIETVGHDLTEVTPPSGFSIEIGAATTVLFASQIGIPVSTTHCKVGSVVFVGLCRGRNKVHWHIFRNIVLAWFITVPASATFSAGIMAALRAIFYVAPSVNLLSLNGTNGTDFFNATTAAATSAPSFF